MKKILLFFTIIIIIFIIFMDIYYFTNNKIIINENNIIMKQEHNNIDTEISNNYLNNQVGYIYINDTNIDSKVMQYTDNDYYLTHDNEGNYNIFGSIYMDYRNNIDNQKILIFGHNTKNTKSSPFKDLEKYGNESFYKNHSIINLELNGKMHNYKIFSVIVTTNTSNEHMKLIFTNDEWNNHLKWLIDESIYNTNVDVDIDDKIIILQTCYYKPDDSFILISAKEI